ncbi:hypothetical protein P691DRAFT_800071 [Macrolepiota fuliginosa MF-IS2]|uniref:TPPC8 first Ig-like domain-containing protein n=1 Tax=Macrolepiota fuliginosa MF-IS2 TaxID=1400762 RepID=A0A9P5XQE3_9AGAR|nr:hypothetical protein P691DRAFT_800071 [Macrolepiota fuliginosa MF-IS2]
MARVIPSSLTPHVCILPSPDLSELLESSSLPSLPEILQSFSPLPQVTTRTTSLTSVPHATFALRFSDLYEIEEACREDEERRAARLIDWMSGRINQKCLRWVSEMEESGGREKEQDGWRTPWWDEVRRCAEGDHVPSRHEGWNHPAAVILAASTNAPNPLQAITALHSRPSQLPPWVDSNYLKYTLIIHPQNSPLSNEEAIALYNAVKKQFGLDVYLLSLALPSPPPAPVPVPPSTPRLPRPTFPESPPMMRDAKKNSTNAPANASLEFVTSNSLRLEQSDIQQTSKFAREFVVGCLIPWMEKNVLEWSEAFTSNRRLPSRLFSSTRRLFGSPSSTPIPTHNSSSSIASLPRSSTSSINGHNVPSPPSQQRRLAEFATILGDFKLAVTVWESLRKESKGGSDILPILVSPSPALALHASNTLANIHAGSQDLPPQAQFRALLYAVRWEAGIPLKDFLNDVLEGERWLVWAAGNAEETPAALLIAHAAYLTSKKRARRRAAYWYAVAASRLEKCGIKPLTMHLLRKAQELYKLRPPKELSPSFWDAEGKTAAQSPWFDAIMSGIEHPLGRLLYTTGDVLSAVQLFLGLLRGSETSSVPTINGVPEGEMKQPSSRDKLSLDDFRVAFGHLKATGPEKIATADLRLPFKFCQVKQSKLRFPGDGAFASSAVWEKREGDWRAFWRSRGGKEGFVKSGSIVVGETFWVDLVLRNPLDAELNLTNLTLVVRDMDASQLEGESDQLVDVDTIEEVVLAPREFRTVSIAITPQHSGSFQISLAKYDFLSLLPTSESLSIRGLRLNATTVQRQQPTYAPDVLVKFDVAEATHKLAVSFVEGGRLGMLQGERRVMNIWMVNMGSKPVKEIWMIPDAEDEIWVGDAVAEGEEQEEGEEEEEEEEKEQESGDEDNSRIEVVKSSNSLLPPNPLKIPVPGGVLEPEEGVNIPLTFHTELVGEKQFCLVFVYREGESDAFHMTRISRTVDVQPLFHVTSVVEPAQSSSGQFAVNVSLRNLSNSVVQLTQVSTVSPLWSSSSVLEDSLPTLSGAQSCHVLLKAQRWMEGQGSHETIDFVKERLSDVLNGRPVGKQDPPPIDLCCSSVTEPSRNKISFTEETISTFTHGGRRNFVAKHTSSTHVHIPSSTHPHIFPLYSPTSFSIILFWELENSSTGPVPSTLASTLTSTYPSPSASRSLSLGSSRYNRYPRKPRSGHITVHGLTLGAVHAPLQGVIEEFENAKVKMSMFAETVRDNAEMLQAIKSCEWNQGMNPLDVVVEGPNEVVHDFSSGPCWTSVDFTIRNYSLTHEARFVLKLNGGATANGSHPPLNSQVLPPPHATKLSFRGLIPSSGSVTLHPKLWITRPGTYSLDGWKLDTEVLENSDNPEPTSVSQSARSSRKIRHRYTLERPVSNRTCLVVKAP